MNLKTTMLTAMNDQHYTNDNSLLDTDDDCNNVTMNVNSLLESATDGPTPSLLNHDEESNNRSTSSSSHSHIIASTRYSKPKPIATKRLSSTRSSSAELDLAAITRKGTLTESCFRIDESNQTTMHKNKNNSSIAAHSVIQQRQQQQHRQHAIVSSSSISSTDSHPTTQEQAFSISNSLWSTSYQANDPCEDRHCSLTNVLLYSQDRQHQEGTGTETETDTRSNEGTVRMSLFGVLDGHGGPAVAEYASKLLLPMLARNISSSLNCGIAHPGLFQVQGRTRKNHFSSKKVNSVDHGHGHYHSDSSNDDDDDDDDDGVSLSSIDSTTSSTAADSDHVNKKKNWYSAPEHNDVLQLPTSLNCSPSPFIPGSHSEQEQNVIAKTIQQTFLELDQDWINGIDPLKSHQSFLVHSGTWNSGACCLVNVILQRIPCSSDNGHDDDDDDDADDDVECFTGEKRNECSDYKAMLYSSHTGDCRAVLLSGRDLRHETEHGDNSSQSDDLSFHGGDSDNNAENEFKCVSMDNRNGRNSRKRMLLNPCHANVRSFKRGRMWIQDDHHGNTSSMEISDWEKDCEANHSDYTPGQSQRRPRLPSRSRSPSPVPQIKSYPKEFVATTLTEDHTPYNQKEASLVRERCQYAPRAIATSTNGGIQRVAGSLSVTRALGDAYLKTPKLSFPPYKAHAPYISALPEVSARILTPNDRLLVLASDGIWERANGDTIAQWTADFFKGKNGSAMTKIAKSSSPPASVERGRMRRLRMLPTRKSLSRVEQETVNARILNKTHISDMIVAKVLKRAGKKHKLSLRALMEVPKGHSRRTKHDDLTTIIVDLDGFTY
jgi:pyruvate dehydrogenase phosphatase